MYLKSSCLITRSSVLLIWNLLVLSVNLVRGVDLTFTIEVAPGSKDCFHQTLSKDTQYETEYQVLDGGDLDITYTVLAPSGYEILTDVRKTGEVHRLTASETGDYAFCFNNEFSHFTSKVVFFEFVTDDDDDEDDDDSLFGQTRPNNTFVDASLDQSKAALEKIHNNLQKSIQIQKLFSAIESRDRSISEYNFERVNFWSTLQVIIMIVAGAANVILIRGLFASREKASHGTKVRT